MHAADGGGEERNEECLCLLDRSDKLVLLGLRSGGSGRSGDIAWADIVPAAADLLNVVALFECGLTHFY